MLRLSRGGLFLREFLQGGRRDRAFRQTIVHEGDIVLEDDAAIVPPVRLHGSGVEPVDRGFRPRAIGGHRAAPGLIGGIVEVRRHDFGQRHRTVADRLEQLIDDGHRGRLERSHARPIEDEAPPGAREQSQDHRMVLEYIRLKHLRRVVIELEHHGIERQHVLRRGVGRTGDGAALDRAHKRRRILSVCRRAQAQQ